MTTLAKISLYDLTPPELESFFLSIDQPAYRAKQVLDFLYRHPVESFDQLTTLSKALRERLASTSRLSPLTLRATLESEDGAIKHVYEVAEPAGKHASLESVWMPSDAADLGGTLARYTLCVSSQLGCAAACRYCATGSLGLHGQLTAGQIVYQVVHCKILYGTYPDAILFMGMGEPMHNFEAVCAATEILTNKEALGFSCATNRHVDLRRTGAASRFSPSIPARAARDQPERRHRRGPEQTHSSEQENDMQAIRDFIKSIDLVKGDTVTLEYVVLAEINDTPEQARALSSFLRPIADRVKVNLIPYNPVPNLEFKSPNRLHVKKFAGIDQSGRG